MFSRSRSAMSRAGWAGALWCLMGLAACSSGGGGDGGDDDGAGVPPAPTGLSATAGRAEVALAWNPVEGADGYTLYWGTAAGLTKGSGTPITLSDTSLPWQSLTETAYTHGTLTNGTPYFYIVTATNAQGESDASAEATATPMAPPVVYFSGSTDGTNFELWTSDGTAAGTALLKEINSVGTAFNAGTIVEFAEFGGKHYFAADDGVNGEELWVTDGTAAGTVMLKNLADDPPDSRPVSFTVAGNTLFFAAYPQLNYNRFLLKTDGTAAGTVALHDSTVLYNPFSLVALGTSVVFAADSQSPGAHSDLMKSDGTTVTDLNVNADASSSPNNLVEMNGEVFFAATIPLALGTELRKYNGTAVSIAHNICSTGEPEVPCHGYPNHLHAVGTTLYYSGTSTTAGVSELYKLPSGGSPTLVKQVHSGAVNQIFSVLGDVNSKLIFVASNGPDGTEIWVSDGSGTGTVALTTFPGSPSIPLIGDSTVLGGAMYVLVYNSDGNFTTQIWKTDGTSAGTAMVFESPASYGSCVRGVLGEVNGTILFYMDDVGTDAYLWKTVWDPGGNDPIG